MRTVLDPLTAGLLALLLAAASLCAGCGGPKVEEGGGPAGLSPQASVVDRFLRGLVDGDTDALLSALPPETLQEILQDMSSADEQGLASVLARSLRNRFPYAAIREIRFRTFDRGEGRAVVRCWGVFESAAEGEGPQLRRLEEEEAMEFRVAERDGAWYLDL
jgi:hypothetical protein